MGRLTAYISSVKANSLLYIVLTLQLTFVFLILNANISEINYNKNRGDYLDPIPDHMYFLSGAANYVTVGDNRDFENLIADMEAGGSVSVGYHIEEGLIMEKDESKIIPCFYLNPVMTEMRYKLKAGNWFTNAEQSICEIILGGELSNDYEINEKVTLYQSFYEENKVTYKQIEAVVVGILEFPAQVMNLGYSSNYPTYGNLLREYENVILTNHKTVLSPDRLRYPLSSMLILDRKEDGQFYDEMSQYGQTFRFAEIDAYSSEGYIAFLKTVIPENITMLVMIVFSMICVTYMFTYKIMKSISILMLCGMSRKMCRKLILGNSIILILFSMLLVFFLYKEKNIHSTFFSQSPLSWWNAAGSGFIILLYMMISMASAVILSKKSIQNLIRRFE